MTQSFSRFLNLETGDLNIENVRVQYKNMKVERRGIGQGSRVQTPFRKFIRKLTYM